MSCTLSTISIGKIAWLVVIFGIKTMSDISKLLYLWNLRQFLNMMSGIYAKYHIQIMLLFVYTTTRKRFVIFTCRCFKLSWNTTALSQSNCRKFSCSSIITKITIIIIQDDCYFHVHVPIFKSSRHITHSPFSCSSTSSEKKHGIWFTSLH